MTNYYIENAKALLPIMRFVHILCLILFAINLTLMIAYAAPVMETEELVDFAECGYNGSADTYGNIEIRFAGKTALGVPFEYTSTLDLISPLLDCEDVKDNKVYDTVNERYVLTEGDVHDFIAAQKDKKNFASTVDNFGIFNTVVTLFFIIVSGCYRLYPKWLAHKCDKVASTAAPTWCIIQRVSIRPVPEQEYSCVDIQLKAESGKWQKKLRFLTDGVSEKLRKGERVLCRLGGRKTTCIDLNSLEAESEPRVAQDA